MVSAYKIANEYSDGIELNTINKNKIYPYSKNGISKLPLFIKPIFNNISPEKNYLPELKLDLNEHLVENPTSTFLIRVTGDSMINAGINPNDTLVVDKEIEPEHGRIVVAEINNKLLVKRIRYNKDEIYLISENSKYPIIKVKDEDKFEIWGVVTSVIRQM